MSNWNLESSKQKLQSIIDSNMGYYSYSLARYLNDVTVDLQYFTEYNDSVFNYRYYNVQDPDLAQSPKVNVIKSVIDSLVSKLANQKVRPYFNPVNGLFSTRAIIKQAQQYFDIVFDKEHVQEKISKAYRNGCIFGIGYVFFNPFLKTIEVPGTWQVAVANTEAGYGKPTKLLIEYKNFPVTLLDKYELKGKYSTEYVNFKLMFDIIEKKMYAFVNNVKAIEKPYKAEQIPVIPIYHTKPVFGTRTVSIVDELDGIQTNIDIINSKISAAAQLTPANVTYVETGSSLQPADISNKTGKVYSVKMGPGQNQLPVVNVSPAPFDPMWNQLLESYVKQAYEIIGISQMSAQSQKPAGLDSGVALQTLSDIESDRFMTQVESYVRAFVDLANLIIEVMDDDSILPKSVDTSEYSWEDVRKQKDLFKIQFSAMSILSKDPQTKLQQIMQLSQIGLITADKLATYLDSPDLEDVYKNAASIADAVESVIDKAINKEDYEIPDYVSYQSLLTSILGWENKLFASNDIEAVKRLNKLKEKLLNIMNEDGFVDLSNSAPEEPMAGENMSATGLTNEDELAAQAQSFADAGTDNTPDNIANPIQANSMEITNV